MSFKKILVMLCLLVLVVLAFWQFNDQQPIEEFNDAELASMAFRQQILHASDLVAGVAAAVKNDDQAAIREWQQKAIEVAKAAELTDRDIDFIRSEKGQEYLVFHAKRALFNRAFEQHYYELKGIDALKTRYPEARDLFAEADKLIAARDAIIEDIANELQSDEIGEKAALKEARALWQARFRAAGQPLQEK